MEIAEQAEQAEQKIVSLSSDLEKLTPSKVESDDKYSYIGVYSNDLQIAEKIPFMQKVLEDLASQTSDLKVGLVIDSGGILSLGKEFPQINLWIVLDKSPGLIDIMKRYCKVVSSAANTQQLVNISSDFGGTEILDQEKESYSQYHYLENEGNLQKTQQFLAKKRVVFMNADLLDADFMAKAGNILKSHQAKIGFANLTNVMEWIPGYQERISQQKLQFSLDTIPFSKNCLFLYTVSMGGFRLRGKVGRSPLNAATAIGFGEYLDKANA